MIKNVYNSEHYLKIKRKLYQDKLNLIISDIEYKYHTRLSIKQFIIRYFQYLIEVNDRELKGDRGEFFYEMVDYFKKLDVKYYFPHKIWKFNIAKSFINNLYDVSDSDIVNLMILLNLILEGKLNYSPESIIRVLPYQGGNIKFPFEHDYIVSFNFSGFLKLVIQIIPILYPILNEEGKPIRFEFHHELILVGLGPENQKNSIGYYEIDKYFRNQQTSPNFFANMKLIKEKINDNQKITKIGEIPRSWKHQLYPRQFQPVLLDSQDYVYNEFFKRWIPASTQNILDVKLDRINQFSANHYLIQKYSQQPSSFQLMKIIQNIPNFKVNLTSQQQEIISNNGDQLVIGRSGTGKTTCALLRLFTTDILFKIRSKLDQINSQSTDIQLNQQQQGCQLKTVFITASPLLACQVKRMYDKLVQNIQDVINNKKKNQKNKNETQVQSYQDELDQSTFQIIDAIKNDQEQQGQQEQTQEDEFEDQEIDDYEKEMGQFQRFSDINEFPIFVTLRKFLFLVDASLINSFFTIFGSKKDRSSQWHNEQFGQMRLSQNNIVLEKKLEEFNQKLMDEIDQSDYIQTNLHEVTQDVFVRIFWPKILQIIKSQSPNARCSDPFYVWAEICTKIKGHDTSHEFPDKYMSYENYYYLQGLPEEQCSFIYEAFQIYEQLKFQLGYYDLLDLVNHINQELAFGNDLIEKIHYLMLDELQDVPRAVLILLDQLTELGLFCCGDNAQNIAKGVGFKFFEVQNCLLSYRNNKKKTTRKVQIFDLNVNFRSHNKILQLANSVIRMIEILFPFKIDKLKKETSNLKGPKPVVIKTENVKQLLNNLCGFFSNQNNAVEFGCNQVIIVKDQESKSKLPIELQNILCLTIYEAKGLEFDDVILYNFFHDSTVSTKDWESLGDLEPHAQYLKKSDYEKFITIHETDVISSNSKKENELVEIWQLKTKNQRQNSEISMDLCQELKLLYVAITRPKKRLIIFDQSLEKRRVIQNIWMKLDAVKVMDWQTQNNDAVFQLQQYIDSKETWKRQGFKMFRMSNYDQAAKCFRFAGENLLEKKSIAYNIIVSNAHITNNHKQFLQAAILFEEIGLLQRAAQCYFTSKEFQKAYEIYEQLGLIHEVAESAYFAQKYQIAAQKFEILGDVRRTIDCYCLDKDWDNVIIHLNKYKNEFSDQERLSFLNQFFPNYLQNLSQQVEAEELYRQEESIQSESFIIQNSILNESQNKLDSSLDNSEIIIQKNNQSSLEILNLEEKDQSQSFQIENESEQNFEHLSIFDPEDEWLKQDQKSLIRSMSSNISHQSEYSNIVLLNQPAKIDLIKSRSNIFVSNNVLQQLIQKLQLFSNEFKSHLDKQKYKAVQLSNRNENDKELDHIVNFIYDLDTIDIDSIYMILDILEQFRSYKLCIYLCNNFKLATYLGRYFVSLVSMYSPLAKNKAQVQIQMVTLGSFRKNLLEQSAISQIAMNNILENINPSFLTFKNEDKLTINNSLGLNCYQELIGLGFWKTLIYQLNFRHSVDLCMSFNHFSDCIEVFNKVKQNRKSEFSEEETFNFTKIQYYQIIKLIKGQKEKAQDFVKELNDVFQITKNYYKNNNLETEENLIDQIFVNANIYKKKMNFNEKLKQIEAVIVSFEMLKITIDYSYEKFVKLFQIQEYFHNQLISSENNQLITESLLMCYGFSIPQGEIMSHFSHSLFLHISSKLIKQVLKDDNTKDNTKDNKQKQESKLLFVDIGYEYISMPFEFAIYQIKNQFSSKIQLIINNQSQKLMDDYEVIDDDVFSIDFQEDWEDILAELLILLMLEQKKKKFQVKISAKKEEAQKLMYIHPLSIYYQKIQQQEFQIFDSEPSQILQLIQRIILKNNLRISNSPDYIKTLIRDISLNLIKEAETKKDCYHSNMIMAINLLNLTDQLSFAVLILQNQKRKQDQNIPYLKYIEFLECQQFGIIEDALGCFLDFNQYVFDKSYLDEQLSHIIRIGLNLLISLLFQSQKKLTIFKVYKEYLNNVEHVDEQNCKLKLGVFKLNDQQLIQDYFEYLFESYQCCCVNYYMDQIYQFLLVFAVNLINTQQVKVINIMIKQLKQKKEIRGQQKLQELLLKEISIEKQEKQEKQIKINALIFNSSYLEEDIIEVEIINTKSEVELDDYYDKCIKIWTSYQNESKDKTNNLHKLISKWKGYRNDHKIYWTEQLGQNLKFVRSLQYYKIGVQNSSIEMCQNLKDLNRQIGKSNFNLNDDINSAVELQRQLQKARQTFVNSLDIHLINGFLDDLSEQMKEMMKGNDVKQKLKQLDMDLRKWEQDNDERLIDYKMLELNRQLLVEKWQNLKAGIKVLPHVKRQNLKTIQEVAEEG